MFIFLAITFALPIWAMLLRSVENPEVDQALPRTVATLRSWDTQALPAEAAFRALLADLQSGSADPGLLGRAAKRLNYEMSDYRALLLSTLRRIGDVGPSAGQEALIALDPRWGEREYWLAIKRNSSRFTDFYFLTALDRRRDLDGSIVSVPTSEAIFLPVFGRTLAMALAITLLCLGLGYPVAYWLSVLPGRSRGAVMFFVLLPFWTALLVRTTAWIVLLQREGLVNHALLGLGVVSGPLPLIFNRTGVLIAMTHVLLPYLILPLYSVMAGIDRQHMRAARSLGAGPLRSFLKVYLPQTVPGVSAGCTLVFILSIGYYVTPELVGGPRDQLLSSFIAYYTNTALNWGLAAALATLLLVAVGILYGAYQGLLGQRVGGV
jgi:putative spermidine/putrescine transport system permease protein